MRLRQLLQDLPVLKSGFDKDEEITGIAYDSREVKAGYLFVAVQGLATDGHLYISEAVKRGATALLISDEKHIPQHGGCAWVLVADTRKALAATAAAYFGHPSHSLSITGITGTNGKTTITHLLASITEPFWKTGLIGTLYGRFGQEKVTLRHTTPEALELQHLLSRMHRSQVKEVVMEVSSHAISLARVEHIDFDAAVFTNLTQDHLDFHKDIEDYFQTKARLFRGLKKDALAVINADDDYGKLLLPITNGRILTYGIDNAADVRAEEIKMSPQGTEFWVKSPQACFPVAMHLAGKFNVYNALAAICIGLDKGLLPEDIACALHSVEGVPGRFEKVDCGQPFTVIVDYAHTPDGLANVLHAARDFAPGKVLVVFGCGGDRDRGKRPLMGSISAELADFSVITSDNPRSEEPLSIIHDIEQGYLTIRPDAYLVEPDRRAAIRKSLERANPGDVVIIAGKGHEDYQIVGNQRLNFVDRLEAIWALESMGCKKTACKG